MTETYTSDQILADDMIRQEGCSAVLRRDGADRRCWAFETAPSTGRGDQLVLTEERVILVSVVGLDVPPDPEQDQYVDVDPITGALGRPSKILPPVNGPRTGGRVVYWQIRVKT